MKITLRELSDDLKRKINKIEEIESNVGSIELSWDRITGKPTSFTPATHSHTWESITDKPTSLPANGGNADTLGGKNYKNFINLQFDMTVEQLNNANYPYSYRTGTPLGKELGLPFIWAHIDYFRHGGDNGHGFQMAYPLDPSTDSTKPIYYRSSIQLSWTKWYTLADINNSVTNDTIEIIDSTDWDTLQTSGIYRVSSISGHNAPNAGYKFGTLIVFRSSGYQINQTFHTEYGEIWSRNNYLDGREWRNWCKVYTDINKPTPQDIGASPVGHEHDRVNGIKFYPGQPLQSNGNPQYFYAFNGGSDGECYVKALSEIPVNGHRHNASDINNIAYTYMTNAVDINDTNLKQFYGTAVTGSASAPNTDWWHIINVPHGDNNGYGGQLAIGYHGNAGLQVRSAAGTSWGGWYDIIGQIESLKSHMKEAIKGERIIDSGSFDNGDYKTVSNSGFSGYIYIHSMQPSMMHVTVDGFNISNHKDCFLTYSGTTCTYRIPFSESYSLNCDPNIRYTVFYTIVKII